MIDSDRFKCLRLIVRYLATRLSSPVCQANITDATKVRPSTVLRICGVMAPRGSSSAQQHRAEKCMV